MQVAITRDALHAALAKVGAAARRDERTGSGVALTASLEGRVTLEASDATLAVRCRVPAAVQQAGMGYFPHGELATVVGTLPPTELALTFERGELTLRTTYSTYRLTSADSAGPPSLFDTAAQPLEHVLTGFRDRLAKVQSAAAKTAGDPAPHFAGVHVTGAYYLATDRYTLAVAWHNDELGAFAETLSPRILPLLQEADSVRIGRSGDQLSLEGAGLALRVQRLVGEFPTPERVLNRPIVAEVQVPRPLFADALRRLSKVGGDVTLAVADGALHISAMGRRGASYGEERVTCALRGTPPTVRVNARYLLGAAAAFDTESVTLRLTGALTPVYLTCKTHAHAVMPLQPLGLEGDRSRP